MNKNVNSPAKLQSDGGGAEQEEKTKNDAEKLARAAADVEREYKADIYLYSGEIGYDGFGKLVGLLEESDKPNALLILTTGGGSASAAYQIARFLQKTYKEFFLYAPSYCKSAGTIIALGADKLIMDVFSELGPLDVQLPSRDELWEQRSGLISKSAFKSLTEASFDMYQQFMLAIKYASQNRISFKTASDVSSKLTCQLMSPIYSQVNPDVIGSDFRELSVAMEYGKRLAEHSKNASKETVMHLVRNYPSHDFIIDDDEARQLFAVVEAPKPSLYSLIECIGEQAFEEADPPCVLLIRGTNADQDQPGKGQDRQTPDSEAKVGVDGGPSRDQRSSSKEGATPTREGANAPTKPGGRKRLT